MTSLTLSHNRFRPIIVVGLVTLVCVLFVALYGISVSPMDSGNINTINSTLENWFDGCQHVYVDAGSNIGVQIRKLFEPELYPRAKALKIFDETFGLPGHRKRAAANGRLCAVGFEANPSHRDRILQVQKSYQSCGWKVMFYVPGAVGDTDGEVKIFSDNATKAEEWGASMYDWGKKNLSKTVPMYDLSKFVQTRVSRRRIPSSQPGDKPAHVLMKMDIEGAELKVLPHMLMQGTLCQRHINSMFIEWHERMVPSKDKQKFKLFRQSIHGITGMDPNNCKPTVVIGVDDESYLHDGKPLPNCKH